MKPNQTNSNIQDLALAQIVPSDFNPRKTFKDVELAELAESIKKQGVLQPIMVRPKGKKFEIIYGERRYRASMLAGLKTISALVRDLTDKEAIEFAITENLQRQDVAPLEEAKAYQYLIDNAAYKITDLIERFGKSDGYIRNRLRLNDLIEPLAQLLSEEQISLMVAQEFAKCAAEIQEDVFNNRYSEGVYYTWFNKSNHEVISALKNNYTSQLQNYYFDKSDCEQCRYNSACEVLFAPENAVCTNRECLKNKNTTYLISQAQALNEQYPGATLAHASYNCSKECIEALKETGEQFVEADLWRYNDIPKEPIESDFEDQEEYEDAKLIYSEFFAKQEAGEVAYYLFVGDKDVTVKYVSVKEDENTNKQTPLQKLEDRDTRYAEIMHEKITEDVGALRKKISFVKEYSECEEKIMYFGMAEKLDSGLLKQIGLDKSYLSEKEKLELVENLTEEQKVLIKRAYILSTLDGAAGQNIRAKFLLEFAKYHVEDEVTKIEKQHQAEYDKRHTNIAKKKALL